MPVVTGIVVGRAGACLLCERHTRSLALARAKHRLVAWRVAVPGLSPELPPRHKSPPGAGYFVDLGPREACDAPRVGAALPTHT